MNFLASPEIVTALSFAGSLSFSPLTDTLPASAGSKPFKFTAPNGQMLPTAGFTAGDASYVPTPSPRPVPDAQVVISPESTRLEVLEPFMSHWEDPEESGLELPEMKVLMRVRGKCTTDHISAAGPWL
jgi:homoaconitase